MFDHHFCPKKKKVVAPLTGKQFLRPVQFPCCFQGGLWCGGLGHRPKKNRGQKTIYNSFIIIFIKKKKKSPWSNHLEHFVAKQKALGLAGRAQGGAQRHQGKLLQPVLGAAAQQLRRLEKKRVFFCWTKSWNQKEMKNNWILFKTDLELQILGFKLETRPTGYLNETVQTRKQALFELHKHLSERFHSYR